MGWGEPGTLQKQGLRTDRRHACAQLQKNSLENVGVAGTWQDDYWVRVLEGVVPSS